MCEIKSRGRNSVVSSSVRLSESAQAYATRHPDLRPGTPQGEYRSHQFGLLTGLAVVGEANQKTLSAGFAMDSTTLTRTLALLRRQGWISIKRGKDRRERVLRLTPAGKRQLATAQPHWQEAERRLKQTLGERNWKQMQSTISEVTAAAADA